MRRSVRYVVVRELVRVVFFGSAFFALCAVFGFIQRLQF